MRNKPQAEEKSQAPPKKKKKRVTGKFGRETEKNECVRSICFAKDISVAKQMICALSATSVTNPIIHK
jgi:hypothetical protein